MRQQGSLLFFDGSNAKIGIYSKPLFKMAQGRIENVREAFQKVFNKNIEIILEVMPEEIDNSAPGGTVPVPKSKGTDCSSSEAHKENWQVKDRVTHKAYGTGEVTHIFGAGANVCLAIKFPGHGRKIIDPKISSLRREN